MANTAPVKFLENTLEKQKVNIRSLEESLDKIVKEKKSEEQKRKIKDTKNSLSLEKKIKKNISLYIKFIELSDDEENRDHVDEYINEIYEFNEEELWLQNLILNLRVKTLELGKLQNKNSQKYLQAKEKIKKLKKEVSEIECYVKAKRKIINELNVLESEAEKLLEKAEQGRELDNQNEIDWVNERLLPNCVIIDQEEYSQMCINALKVVPYLAASDYGSTRQRDLGQLWADTIRGYLGEIAFVKFLKKHWNISARLDHEKGSLDDFLSLDIHEVTFPNKSPRPPKIKIGIKATKFNGIWLDIPGDQFHHSNIHVFVKVGVSRDHLFAFFKEISVFKDKILKIGEDIGTINKTESEELFGSLPSFQSIPAYICGFVNSKGRFKKLSYKGQKKKNFTIYSWKGPINWDDDEENIRKTENIKDGNIRFEGIGEFSHDDGYLFNAGNLSWKKSDWDEVIQSL